MWALVYYRIDGERRKIMSIGEKIADLRKRDKMSQEELAEKVGVARQTISKWELDETSPDIKQAQELSKIFHISLDELVGNEIQSVVVEKISNTEKLAGMIIKILKVAGIIIVAMIVIEMAFLIGAIFFLSPHKDNVNSSSNVSISCTVDDGKYEISLDNKKVFNCKNCTKDMEDDIVELIDYDDYGMTQDNILNYFEDHKINCEMKE